MTEEIGEGIGGGGEGRPEKDEDAVAYFDEYLLQEQEQLYFTDELPHGGVRFWVHPGVLIKYSFIGLLEYSDNICVINLLFSPLPKSSVSVL